MKNLAIFCIFLFMFFAIELSAQEESIRDSVKTGIIPIPIPAVAYDSDVGFLYGIVLKLTHFGDGSRYPLYDHFLHLQWTRTTKGSGENIIRYDSDKLIRGIRTSLGLSYLTEQALDFYGFNGYKALYDADYVDENSSDYKSRAFYKMDRRMLLFRTEFTGKILGDKLKWFTGFEYRNMKMDTVDRKKLNEGKNEADKLPYVGGGLFGMYAGPWNIIPGDQIHGGTNTLIKAGLIYDTRDNEPNPMKGMWSEVQLLMAPSFLASNGQSYTRLILAHRQYFTLIPKNLNFAYRLSYQSKLSGEIPYYMLPFYFNSPPNYTNNGLGGAKTMRGILRNRVVGNDYFLGNIELRWKFLYFQAFKQNIYLALSGFMDGGMVVNDYEIDTSNVPPGSLLFFPDDPEQMHLSAGIGIHLAINHNTVIAIDYGRSFDDRDGLNGLYIGLDFLF